MSLDYRQIIADESARFVELLRTGPLDAQVPGCPEWKLSDLGQHIIGVQRWATRVITHGVPSDEADPASLDWSDVANVLEATTVGLLEAIDASDPDSECWNFTSGAQVTSFWYRRQALEVAIHCWDADSAVNESPTPIAADVAADCIDEFVHLVINRVVTREGLDLSQFQGDVHVHCTDTPGEWTFEVLDGALAVSDEHRKSAVAVRGGASELALFLYGRTKAETVDVFGDTTMLDSWSAAFGF